MAVIQLSKILLRRGPETDLGTDTLDPGEFAFTSDTGRLFLGSDPAETGPWSNRTLFPYKNIEVLTEASLDTYARLHDRMNRLTGPVGMVEGLLDRYPYVECIINANVSTWTNVPAMRFDDEGILQAGLTEDVILSTTKSISAKLDYFLFDGTDLVRSGVMSVMHDGNTAIDQAVMSDEHVADFQIAATGTPLLVDDVFDTGIRFRVMREGTDPNYTFRLQYKNETANNLRLQFRAMVAAKPA
jgi:hypothetical protein